jgi:hypothetical protein
MAFFSEIPFPLMDASCPIFTIDLSWSIVGFIQFQDKLCTTARLACGAWHRALAYCSSSCSPLLCAEIKYYSLLQIPLSDQ